MRSLAAVLLALSFAMTPLGAATRPAHTSSARLVQAKATKKKIKTRKPKRKVKSHARAN